MGERLQGAGRESRPNAAKEFLSSYRGLYLYYQELTEQIRTLRDRATDVSAKLKPVSVQTGGAGDTVGDGAARIADAEMELPEAAARAARQLARILQAVEAVPDAMQRAVLSKRYISGKNWDEICTEIGYEKTRTFELHGWGLLAVNRWLEANALED